MSKIDIYSKNDAQIADNLVRIIYCNPFLEERQRLDSEVLGSLYKPSMKGKGSGLENQQNMDQLRSHCEALLLSGRKVIVGLSNPQAHPQFRLYEHLVYFHLYHAQASSMDEHLANCIQQPDNNLVWSSFKELSNDYDFYLTLNKIKITPAYTKSELTSFLFQIRRAFYHTQASLIGQSEAMRKLRARVWNSIFTHDMERYLRSLFYRMENVFTLIEGPSGSGKELVAGAIGLSRFIPFNEQTLKFNTNYRKVFYPINPSALSETLIESELFGHQKGAFTGALQNRAGYFESCGPYGTVFLDEIGETDPTIQVQLLRVLQTRQFQRLGDIQPLKFEGKVMAATNRNLALEMSRGKFRTDFYYRLCADRIETPSLVSMIENNKSELEIMVGFIAEKIAGPLEKAHLTEEVVNWIRQSMPKHYPWPGNFRELEQCVRNVMVHGEYKAQLEPTVSSEADDLTSGSTPTLNQWIQVLVNREFAKTPNLAQVADRLQVDRRTVKKYLSHSS